jgi:tRNA pseudouridine55 synthase
MGDGSSALGTAAPASWSGILLLDKPVGVSSFQALRPLKRLFPKTKIGHAGTLDPAASGLLLVGIGSGTRLLEYLEGMPKTYSFTARFGLVSDSYDMEGSVAPFIGGNPAALDAGSVEKAMAPFRGPIRQTPPVYSAIKIDGERACDRVRAGETVVLESRQVTVHSLELKAFHPAGNADAAMSPPAASAALAAAAPSADMEMVCSKGTYVRSLVHDLGASLSCGAVTDKIRRLAIGPFRVEDAVGPEGLAPGMALHPMDLAVAHLPSAVVPSTHVGRFLNGQSVAPEHAPASGAPVPDPALSRFPIPELPASPGEPDPEYRALDDSGRLLAIATLSPQGLLCPRKVLARI